MEQLSQEEHFREMLQKKTRFFLPEEVFHNFGNGKEIATCSEENFVNIFKVLDKLMELRDKLQLPIRVNSFYRSPKHNREVGGAPKSQHMEGLAADLHVAGLTSLALAKAAKDYFDTIIVYNHFVHCDLRGKKNHWQSIKGKYLPIDLESR